MEWRFIEHTLEDAGVPSKLIEVLRLVSSSSCKLLWNREMTYEITPRRGLRQGDPLSLYLFVICIERLGHWFEEKVTEGRLKPERAARKGPGVSYLFFADELLLFSEAVEEHLMCLREGWSYFAGHLARRSITTSRPCCVL